MREVPRPTRRHPLFRLLLRLLPSEFHTDFGRDMQRDFAEQHDEARRAGTLAVAMLWMRTLPSVARLALAEQSATFATDLHFALRLMRRAPGFAIAAVATLAVGIGAATAVFSTVNATLLRPLPFPESDQLVDVHTRTLDGRMTTGLLSPVEIQALSGVPSVVAHAAGYLVPTQDMILIQPDGSPLSTRVTGVTEGFFDVLGRPMTLGRAFSHDEHVRAGGNVPPSLIASYETWQALFGGDPGIVGRAIRLAGGPASVTVIGVAAPDVELPRGTQFWFNIRLGPDDINHNYGSILRLRPGAGLEALREAAATQMAGLARTYPSDANRAYVVRSLVSSLVGDLRPLLLIVLGATMLLLVLASANVTNLLLARGTARSREIAVRVALGAGRGRVVRQMLAESLVLATAGAVAGLALAYAGVRVMLALGASTLPRLQTVPFDAYVMLFAIAVLGCCAMAMGVAPAWRLSGVDVRTLLAEHGRTTSAGSGASKTMRSLIVAEVALAVALVAGAAWLVQSFARLRATDPGFAADGRLVVDVQTTRRFARFPEDARAWVDGMMESIRGAAADSRVGAALTFPFLLDRDGTLYIEVRGEPRNPDDMRGARIRPVSPGFFEALDVALLSGRTFSAADRSGGKPVAIVNRAFLRMFLPDGGDPLNRTIAFGYPQIDPASASRIVGVVEDMRYESLAEEAQPACYLVIAQARFPPRRQMVVVAPRNGDPDSLVAPIRAAMKRFDPQAIVGFESAASIVARTLQRQQLGMTLMLIFGATALALGAIGIYGVIAYAAAQRRSEIATRMALGASRWDVFWLMFGSGQRLGGIGLLAGVAVAAAGGRLVATNVFAMRASDPVVLAGAFLAVAAVTLIAIAIPAVRACRLDPSVALRSE